MKARAGLLLAAVVERLTADGVRLPSVVLDAGTFAKTVAFFEQALRGNIADLYNGKMSERAFADDLVRLIDEQYDRAFREGLRAAGVKPEDADEDWLTWLDDRKLQEIDYIEPFAAEIVQAREQEAGVQSVNYRSALWANRYNEVVNEAKILAGGDQKFEWKFGDTDHCDTCLALNGIVAWGKEWEESGVHPQGAKNDRLSCGGWRCLCELVPTSKRRTKNALQEILKRAKEA